MVTRGGPRMGASAALKFAMSGLLPMLVLLSGCQTDEVPVPTDARTVDLGAFVSPPRERPEVVGVPGADTDAPTVKRTTAVQPLADGEAVTRSTTSETATDPATSAPQTEVVASTVSQQLRVGQRWPIESLVGQINGRPIYADDFFKTIEDRIMILAASPNQQQAKIALRQLVSERFNQLINSELIIAEAQSRLSPEMQQGIFAWLRDMQERTIAQSGGSRSNADEALREQTGMGVDQFIEQRKNYELSADLLRRKVDPRVIVSWRDVERLYDFNRAKYAPDPVYKLGRVRLAKTQQDEIARARAMFAEGKTFADVAAAMKAPNGGAWQEVKVGPEGMEIASMTEDLQAALKPLKPGQVSGEIEQRTHIVWVSVMSEERPPAVTIFDVALQLSLRSQLYEYRSGEERMRYIASLRSRWLSDDIQKMEFRLLTIALTRYFDPSRG